ncbi:MAG: hypothetical protein JWN85_3271 [Gammaproteobacteria bacterium]|nr:hypothetical protein [Gammaproteobacteria bacterium]
MLLSVPPFAPAQMPIQWNPALDRATVNDAPQADGGGEACSGDFTICLQGYDRVVKLAQGVHISRETADGQRATAQVAS